MRLPEGEAVGERSSAGAASDDDDVVGAHDISFSRSARMIRRRGLDQREVRERLREVPEVPAGVGVELLGVEPERRRDPEQPLHQVAGALLLADDRERGHEPERADEERPLLAGQAVVGLVGAVAQDEPVLGQLVVDRQDARAQPLVVARQEAEDRGQERRRRRARRSRSAGAARPARDAVLEDVGADLVRGRAPSRPAAPGRRGSRPAWRRGRGRPSTSASRTRSAAARRAPPRSPGRARARRAWRTRPATGRSATAAAAAAGCAACGSRIESRTAPKTSFWRWSNAPLPIRTGRAPA